MEKRGISLKYKLLFVLVTLPLLTLLLYLRLAVWLFESDKIAYVYDSVTAVSQTVASQTESEVRSVLSSIRFLLLQVDLNQKIVTPQGESLFQNDSKILDLWITDGTVDIIHLHKTERALADDVRAHLVSHTCPNDFYLKGLDDDRGLAEGKFLLSFCLKDGERQFTGIASVESKVLTSAYSEHPTYQNVLVDQDGINLFGSQKELSAMNGFSELRDQLRATRVPVLTRELQDGQDAQLASIARLGVDHIFVVTSVSKVKALSAVKLLISKSILFFICLSCVAAIISVFWSNKLTSALRLLEAATRSIASGKFDVKVPVRSRDEVGSLSSRFNNMATEVSRLMVENVEKARMEKELETAKLVQSTLFPEPEMQVGKLKISGFYEPASECGGDWWFYHTIGKRVLIWIGDATGHGAPAALMTTAAKASATMIAQKGIHSPAEAMTALNRCLYETTQGRMNMTFFICSIDFESGELVYSNASHNPPYLLSPKGEPLTKADIEFLDESKGPRLGESADSVYSEHRIQLKPQSSVLFYTDGVFDVQNSEGKEFLERGFLKAVLSQAPALVEPHQFNQAIKSTIDTFQGSTALLDDVTLVTCTFGESTA